VSRRYACRDAASGTRMNWRARFRQVRDTPSQERTFRTHLRMGLDIFLVFAQCTHIMYSICLHYHESTPLAFVYDLEFLWSSIYLALSFFW
jgi:hypothetical protein